MVSRRDREYLDWYYALEGKVGLDYLESMPKLQLPSICDRSNLNQPDIPVSSAYDHRNEKATRNVLIHIMPEIKLYHLVYFIIHIIFSIIERSIQAYYAVIGHTLSMIHRDHRTPELVRKDVSNLRKLPRHLSVILTQDTTDNGLEVLMDEVAALAAWSASAGITQLSVYEKTGILKSHMSAMHSVINAKLASYYRSSSQQQSLLLFAPEHPVEGSASINESSLKVLLLSSTDGRESFVNVTQSLAQMLTNGQLSPKDITQEFVDAQVSGMTVKPLQRYLDLGIDRFKSEPDLLLIFGPCLKLDGYPPWQIRLTEIFCTGEQSHGLYRYGGAVEYQGFLRGLRKYAGAEMRVGR
ncbi:uncharacterized protein N7484_005999 [Penicillium longicatenatum]|uniref:uncharacterized protein n=1 Tax=Penicillium longicatenatum TaxID=1561947 RepID=UPI002548BFE0|nr:uncharacterized protein N7484_005999 [Penicillium longicatenatum]KAJ5643492.1 hypothetical protein N7484_005999 [Penicillium longicatenatum]